MIGSRLDRLHEPLRDSLVAAFAEAMERSGFIGGPEVDRFERDWAAYCGGRYAVGVSSGTSALELALRSSGIREGDEVLVPGNTFFATPAAVFRVGARPVFCDVESETLLIDLEDAEHRVTPRTRAIVPVHLYGNMCDMDAVLAFSHRRNLLVIEDAAQAHGAHWNSVPSGGHGVPACFSFYPGKNLGAFGDAGAIVLDDVDLCDELRLAQNHGRSLQDPRRHEIFGENARLDAIQAKILTLKLQELDTWNGRRRKIASQLTASLEPFGLRPVIGKEGSNGVYHHFVILVDSRDILQDKLRNRGIDARIHYPIPCHHQSASIQALKRTRLPVVEAASRRILSLPCCPSLTDLEVEVISEALVVSLGEAAC